MKILNILKYLFAFLISIEFGFLDIAINIKDVKKISTLFIMMELLIFICYKIDSKSIPKKERIVNIFVPHLFIVFFTSVFNYRYGYGNTFGILGYKKNIGLFTALNLSLESCAFFIFISYIILWYLLCIKLQLKNKKQNKIIIFLFLLGTIIFLLCIILLLLKHHIFDGLMILTLLINSIISQKDKKRNA